ncbi:PGRP1-like protein [Mya arenaria]|uniref:PGRP1-like protein n=1 Tax=Mya arenaria TaxID=6604 RepID=A0ABY7DJM3_MYAAR|nr:peptidoglycan recognition protein 1-like [Mya arenaria]XP_052787859.1 peptidoglycan recognition protein 1-like [Mya arenaria]XP_052787864.1 peptidoglycan recognition protein 1-like [Mya arenaria]WAQ96550.1 PGRP1-like protein [Mya arenaria]
MKDFTLLLIVAEIITSWTFAEQCACATVNVNVRTEAGVGHHILTTLLTGSCLPFKGNRQVVSGASWVNVDYNGQDAWIHEGYVAIRTCDGTGGSQLPGCPHIIPRAEWGARPPTHTIPQLSHTPTYMFIHHGASGFCHAKDDCIAKVQAYQNYHMDVHGWPDIGYSFVVGEDGNIYEARGWDEVGAHTYGYNSVGLAICVIGDFTHRVPNDAALNAVKQLIQCGLDNHKLTSTYTLRGHRDMFDTACPGDQLYALIQHWSHY